MKGNIYYVLEKLGKTERSAFFSAVIFGLITHLHIFSVNYIFHDSAFIGSLGATYSHGRWALGLIKEISSAFFVEIYQLPFINGFISIFFVALAAMVVVSAFEIKNAASSVFVGMVMVAFPSVAVSFAFMFMAPVYSLSMLLSMFAVHMFYRRSSAATFLAGSLLICFSLGIYQAQLSLAASFAMLIVFFEGLRHETGTATLLKKGILFIAMLAAGLILYLAVNKAVLTAKGIALSAYQGIENMGKIEFALFPRAIFQAYYDQLRPSWLGMITCEFERDLTLAVNILSVALFCAVLWTKKAGAGKKLFLLLAFVSLPLAFNSVYLLSPRAISGVHALMRFSLVFTYILPVVLLELLPQDKARLIWKRAVTALISLILWMVPVTYCYRDNTAYLNAELVEEEAEAYYGSMVTRIRSAEGYKDELPVAYIGFGITDSSLTRLPMFGDIYTYVLSYSLEEVVTANLWENFCEMHLGWDPNVVWDVSEFTQMDEVKAMPCYPDDGSIKVINDTVVVKISG